MDIFFFFLRITWVILLVCFESLDIWKLLLLFTFTSVSTTIFIFIREHWSHGSIVGFLHLLCKNSDANPNSWYFSVFTTGVGSFQVVLFKSFGRVNRIFGSFFIYTAFHLLNSFSLMNFIFWSRNFYSLIWWFLPFISLGSLLLKCLLDE